MTRVARLTASVYERREPGPAGDRRLPLASVRDLGRSLHRLVDLARERPARAGSTRVVAIDGPSGSGKTTMALRLRDLLAAGAGAAPQLVHMDDLYTGWDGLAASVPRLVDGVLAPLAVGRPGAYRRWNWHEGRDGDLISVPVCDWLVVEGAGSGSRAAAVFTVALAWLDAPAQTRRRRGLQRDGETFAPHWERWAAQERVLFAAEDTAARADVTLRT